MAAGILEFGLEDILQGIDHLVLPATTLMLARSRLTGLGFTVAPDARHPFGTGNCCVFFKNRTYLEPITILDRAAADMAAAEGSFFVKRLKRFSERQGEGLAMVALKSDDAEADRIRLVSAGLSLGPVFRFARPAQLPDGSQAEIAVALAYMEDPSAPDATFFACQHRAVDLLYQPAFLEHANGALGVGGVVAVAEEPGRFRNLLAAAGGEKLAVEEGAVETVVAGHRLSVLTPARYRERLGIEPPDPKRGLLFAGFDILVEDQNRAVGFAGPTAQRHGGRLVVPPAPGLSAALSFRSSNDE